MKIAAGSLITTEPDSHTHPAKTIKNGRFRFLSPAFTLAPNDRLSLCTVEPDRKAASPASLIRRFHCTFAFPCGPEMGGGLSRDSDLPRCVEDPIGSGPGSPPSSTLNIRRWPVPAPGTGSPPWLLDQHGSAPLLNGGDRGPQAEPEADAEPEEWGA